MTTEQAYTRAAALCSRAEYCTAQIREKLEQWEAPKADAILRQLVEERYIDDARYARAFVADKLRYNHWGRLKLRAALRQKRVPSDAIDQALDTIDPDQYADILQQVLQSKARTLHEPNEYLRRQKLARHAASHGFEPSLILDAVETL